MRIHSFQHVPFEDIGSMAQDFAAAGYPYTCTHWYLGEQPPSSDDYDLLVIMGGPMGVYDEAIYPWLGTEKAAIRNAITSGKKLLGICLGAQLIAETLGARVQTNGQREIGWYPLTLPATASDNPIAQLLTSAPGVFHWHGDTFTLPDGAELLASSQACKHQAFCVGEQIWGFQFHLETTPASARALLEHCAEDLDGSRFTQSPEEIMRQESAFAQLNQTMSAVLKVIIDPRQAHQTSDRQRP